MQLCFLQSRVPKSCILNVSTPGNLQAGVTAAELWALQLLVTMGFFSVSSLLCEPASLALRLFFFFFHNTKSQPMS